MKPTQNNSCFLHLLLYSSKKGKKNEPDKKKNKNKNAHIKQMQATLQKDSAVVRNMSAYFMLLNFVNIIFDMSLHIVDISVCN